MKYPLDLFLQSLVVAGQPTGVVHSSGADENWRKDRHHWLEAQQLNASPDCATSTPICAGAESEPGVRSGYVVRTARRPDERFPFDPCTHATRYHRPISRRRAAGYRRYPSLSRVMVPCTWARTPDANRNEQATSATSTSPTRASALACLCFLGVTIGSSRQRRLRCGALRDRDAVPSIATVR